MTFHSTRYWNLIKSAKTEDEVWLLLERKDLKMNEARQIVNMFRISQKVKAGAY